MIETDRPILQVQLVDFLEQVFNDRDIDYARDRKGVIRNTGFGDLLGEIDPTGSPNAFSSGLVEVLAGTGQKQTIKFLVEIRKIMLLGEDDIRCLDDLVNSVKALPEDRWSLEFPPITKRLKEEGPELRDARALASGVEKIRKSLKEKLDGGSSDAGSAFKGLFSYQLEDADIFAGRQTAIKGLLESIERGKLTVLHSESGAGKTSLLQAGVQASLLRRGHLAIWLLPIKRNPWDEIKGGVDKEDKEVAGYKIRAAFVEKLTKTMASTPLDEFLRQVCDVLGAECRLYLLLDQFEEFFAWWEASEREPFLLEMANCLSDQSLDVRWIVAVRGEDLSNITGELESKYYIEEAFKNQYWLPRLTLAEANTVFEGIENRRGRKFKPELVEAILDDLGKDGGIAPTQLQVIFMALMSDATPTDTSLDEYNAMGGTKAILQNFLDNQTRTIDTAYRLTARHLLKALVTSTRKRASRLEDELKDELETQNFTADQINAALSALIARHLVVEKERDEDGKLTYELVHDYLIDKIELDTEVLARKAAQELLAQGLEQYKRGLIADQPGVLLGEEALAIINTQRRWLRVTNEEEDLLRRSRTAANYRRWLPEMGQVGGLLGFGLAYLLTYACQTVNFSIFFFGLLIRVLPGAIAGMAFVLAIDAVIVRLRGFRNWRSWLAGGLIGACCFGVMLILHKLFETSGGLTPLFMLFIAGLEGATWGAAAGVGAVWALTSRRPGWLLLVAVGLACGVALLLADMVGMAFQGPNFSKSNCLPGLFSIQIFLAGGLAPLFMILPARLGRARQPDNA